MLNSNINNVGQRISRLWRDHPLAIAVLFIIFTSGCATVTEGAKGIAGLSTKALEEGRQDAVKNIYNYNQSECLGQIKQLLQNTGSYIYARSKNMLAIYISEEDTTPVGIFFKDLGGNRTEIEVSSSSTYGKELISARIYGLFNPKKTKGESDAEK
ncbi:MAG: hypothetical protein WC658_00210 [Candidatus Omnitrophota bacterium]